MKKSELNTPVTFIVFNRPEFTQQTFAAISRMRPKKLLIIADGPRSHVPGEKEKCLQVRSIVENIDWDCEITREYSDVNLGCKKRVSSGLDRAFSIFEETIVVEDDCLPNESFFRFCEEMLERYRNDSRVMLINGSNFHPSVQTGQSYLFSSFPSIWGWASWRRVWNFYDVTLGQWPELKAEGFPGDMFRSKFLTRKWQRTFDKTYQGAIDTWDHQLTFQIWSHHGLCVSPMKNLVKNIGFGPEATHTTALTDFANRESFELSFPLIHPAQVATNPKFEARIHRAETLLYRIWSRIKAHL